MADLGEMVIKSGYFFTPLPEPRLASSPKRPFSQPQTNSALFSHAIMPTQPIQLPSCASLGIFTTLESLRDPGVLHAVCREGIATVGIQGVCRLGGNPGTLCYLVDHPLSPPKSTR